MVAFVFGTLETLLGVVEQQAVPGTGAIADREPAIGQLVPAGSVELNLDSKHQSIGARQIQSPALELGADLRGTVKAFEFVAV